MQFFNFRFRTFIFRFRQNEYASFVEHEKRWKMSGWPFLYDVPTWSYGGLTVDCHCHCRGFFLFWDSPPLIACQMRIVWSFYKIPKGGGRRELLVCWMSVILSFWRAGTDSGTHKALFFQPSKPYGMGKAIRPHGTNALGWNLTPKGQRYTSNLIQEEILSS